MPWIISTDPTRVTPLLAKHALDLALVARLRALPELVSFLITVPTCHVAKPPSRRTISYGVTSLSTAVARASIMLLSRLDMLFGSRLLRNNLALSIGSQLILAV
jgi:hypothetical protein